MVTACALAEFCKSQVTHPAKLDSRSHKAAVNIHAGLPLKLEKQVDRAAVCRTAAEHPTARADDYAGESAEEARRLFKRNRLQMNGPGDSGLALRVYWQHGGSHTLVISDRTDESRVCCGVKRRMAAFETPGG